MLIGGTTADKTVSSADVSQTRGQVDHVASLIVNANHGAMCTAVELRISNRIRGFRNGWKCAARSGKFGFGCRPSRRFSRK